ncbi:hypothetical protein OGAPHI_004634 [Ogataea philodendri]|uniref:RRM domain-containing protein n=1 Tax=Ogataea philodendri TaxID=1378263 RepID=A0A9P8P301_9ASCO|nr:uncharacterized protein OGAPHI_004634 [Ogataea philodendri]KAH3664282.1 hypothetical protein OGAPHI_004634 [Ogataea philodendri]
MDESHSFSMGLRFLKSRLSNRDYKHEESLKQAPSSPVSSTRLSLKENEAIGTKKEPSMTNTKRRRSFFNLRTPRDKPETTNISLSDESDTNYASTPKINCINNAGIDLLSCELDPADQISMTQEKEDDKSVRPQSNALSEILQPENVQPDSEENQLLSSKPAKQPTPNEGKADTKKEPTDSDSSAEIVTISKNAVDIASSTKTAPTYLSSTFFTPTKQLTSLFVGDLDKTVNESELKKLFNGFPGLISVKIPTDCQTGKSLGYGYVNYSDENQASIAIEALNYTKLGNMEMRIMPSLRDKTQRERIGTNIFLSNLSSSLTTRALYDRFKKYGKILSCKYNASKQQAFIHFESKQVAYEVVKAVNHTTMDGKLVYAGVHILKKDRDLFGATANSGSKLGEKKDISDIPVFSPATKPTETKEEPSTQFSVFIRNLPLDIEQDVIRSLVEPYGEVISVLARKVPRKKGCWALVTMTNQESVNNAVSHLNLVEINRHQLFVTRAIPKEDKEYSRKQETYPKHKLKILITGLNVNIHKAKFQEWCLTFGSIKSVELYGTYPQESHKSFTAYGYVEMVNEADADLLIDNLKMLGVYCFKVKVEIPRKEVASTSPHTPYISKAGIGNGSTSGSYLDPSKMYQLAAFTKSVENDKLHGSQSVVKDRFERDTQRPELRSQIDKVIGDFATDILGKELVYIKSTGELNMPKIHSLSEHIIKFFWSNKIESFWKFLEANHSQNEQIHPLLRTQIVQSSMYLGIVPKE